ncbi:hypothetical protein Tco_0866610 [Tanacetum coccineum]
MKSRYRLKGLKNEKKCKSDIEDRMDPVQLCNKPLPDIQSRKDYVSILTELTLISIDFLTLKHAEYDESNTYVLERFNTTAGNPVKKILLKLNLSDHRLFKDDGRGEKGKSSDTKLTKDEECESVDSTKYRGMIGTMHLGLWYPKGTGIETVVYVDSDHAGDYVDRKSTSGIYTFVGCCLTSWFSKKQTALAISTTEAKYVSAGKACQQALWMKQALIDYDVRLDDVPIMCDNKGAIDLSKNPVQHSRTKHIEIRHHFLRDNVQKGHISIEKVPSVDNIADILMKPLKRESFNYLRLGLGMMEHIS